MMAKLILKPILTPILFSIGILAIGCLGVAIVLEPMLGKQPKRK